jgi:hypothetical protein
MVLVTIIRHSQIGTITGCTYMRICLACSMLARCLLQLETLGDQTCRVVFSPIALHFPIFTKLHLPCEEAKHVKDLPVMQMQRHR